MNALPYRELNELRQVTIQRIGYLREKIKQLADPRYTQLSPNGMAMLQVALALEEDKLLRLAQVPILLTERNPND
jgi:hypothetical protein